MPAHRKQKRGRHRRPSAARVMLAPRNLGRVSAIASLSASPALGLAGDALATSPAHATTPPTPVATFAQLTPSQDAQYNAQRTFYGKVSSRGGGVPDAPVAVDHQVDGQWQPWLSLVTDSQGVVKISIKPTETTATRLRYAGSTGLAASEATSVWKVTPPPPPPPPLPPLGQRVVAAAAKQAGKPYEWGAQGPGSFDCSGLVLYVYNEFGVDVPRTSQEQYDSSQKVSAGQARPGDLVFFGDSTDSIHHVAIYAGDNMVWHAPTEGEDVRLQEIWDYEPHYFGRYIK
jgi:cell wall-associated NlpC family hydrolase